MSSIILPSRTKPMPGARLNHGHPLARGLVRYWLLNEGSGSIVNELSGRGIQATTNAAGSVTSGWIPGLHGPSLALDGSDDSITIQSLTLTPPFTVAARLRPRTALSSGQNDFFGTAGSSYTGCYLNYFANAAIVSVDFGHYQYFSNPATASPVGMWASWVWSVPTITIADCSLWINGTSLAKGTAGGTEWDVFSFANIGVGRDYYCDIDCDYVAVYSRSLSTQEIFQLYINPFAMFRREPIELWTGAQGPPAGVTLEINVYDTE